MAAVAGRALPDARRLRPRRARGGRGCGRAALPVAARRGPPDRRSRAERRARAGLRDEGGCSSARDGNLPTAPRSPAGWPGRPRSCPPAGWTSRGLPGQGHGVVRARLADRVRGVDPVRLERQARGHGQRRLQQRDQHRRHGPGAGARLRGGRRRHRPPGATPDDLLWGIDARSASWTGARARSTRSSVRPGGSSRRWAGRRRAARISTDARPGDIRRSR